MKEGFIAGVLYQTVLVVARWTQQTGNWVYIYRMLRKSLRPKFGANWTTHFELLCNTVKLELIN